MSIPQNPVPPNLQAALGLLLTLLLTALAVKAGIDVKDPTVAGALTVIGFAAGALLSAGYVWLITHIQTTKVETAEKRAPGITNKKLVGPTESLAVTMSKNDTTNNDPPVEVTTVTPPALPGSTTNHKDE